ncbi:hypothetical protein EST38_g6353 [Candolleomyces aberdarensis]|uniref:Uncharacterized protein n=1 Tax=Candolleomyces aberdarensis TaxID=2316362 RepID=A0A4Q2DJY8_9AGAR|nr:hypothetical protein EST38_g6353 [Candolleomyces aberdarensis]
MSTENRSQSRGREPLLSTGRGGFGNIRQASVSRDRPNSGPDDFSVTRGREPVSNPDAIYSTGRGGAGNLRSPSRDASRGPDRHEKEVIENYVAHQGEAPVSTGRGGLGNINRSRSRDDSRTRTVTTGRGGAGNFREGDGYDANAADEVERKKVEGHPPHGAHSTGRGGFANITEQEEPDVERPSISISHHGSTGRGGAGNIVRN